MTNQRNEFTTTTAETIFFAYDEQVDTVTGNEVVKKALKRM
jgi:hypothetical protein